MPEAYFYHLEGVTAEDVLPDLLQRGFTRGLKMVVEAPDPTRLLAFSQKLWSHEDVAFLPHGLDGEPFPERQMIWLSVNSENPNEASFRFCFGGATPDVSGGYERVSLLFNGGEESEVVMARQLWREFKTAGSGVKYWKKDEHGRWVDMAAKAGAES